MIKNILLAVISAVLFLIGLHPAGLTWLSCLAYLPLFVIAFDKQVRWPGVLALTGLTSIIVYGFGLTWIALYSVHIYFLVLLIIASVLPLYFALYFFITHGIAGTAERILTAATLWLALQWLLALTPLSAAAFEFPFYASDALYQTARIVPFYFVGAVFVGISAALAGFLVRNKLSSAIFFVIFLVLIGAALAWGHITLTRPSSPLPKVAIVQTNLPISDVWRLEHPEEVKAKYRSLALEAARGNPQLIIFPLYTTPFDALREPEFFLALARETKCHILAASHIPREAGKSMLKVGRFDIAILYSPDGKVAGDYVATERPPFRDIGEETAPRYRLIDSPIGKLGILLCYEDSTPRVARTALNEGAQFLVALSNPGHFQGTYVPFYHLMQDRFRAIETGLPLLRASTNGYSAVIDSRGRVIEQSPLSKETILFV